MPTLALLRPVVGSMAASFVESKLPKDCKPAAEQKLRVKFHKYIWHALFYSVVWLWAMRLMFLQEWSLFNQENYSLAPIRIGFPHCADNFAADTEMRLMLLVQLSWYTLNTLDTFVHDRSRGDFWMMVAHHFIAASLILGALVICGHRVGLCITSCFDLTDVVLYCCKMLHMSTTDKDGKPYTTSLQKLQTVLLLMLCVLWTATRIVGFSALAKEMWDADTTIMVASDRFVFDILRMMLLGLLILQCVWGAGVWCMWVSLARQGAFEDYWHKDVPSTLGVSATDDTESTTTASDSPKLE